MEPDDRHAPPGVPPLRGGRAELHPVTQADYDFLYRLEVGDPRSILWRHSGRTPRPEDFAASLWNGVVASFVITDLTTATRCGVVTFYDERPAAGIIYVAAMVGFETRGTIVGPEAIRLAIDHAFAAWPIRMIVVETIEPNLKQFESSLASVLRYEGRITDAEFAAGRYWDKIFCTIRRSAWAKYRSSSGRHAAGLHASLSEACGLDDITSHRDQRLLDDLQLDSLAIFEVVVAIEEELDVAVPDELVASWETVDDVLHYIEQGAAGR
jgi:acyl carrier protein